MHSVCLPGSDGAAAGLNWPGAEALADVWGDGAVREQPGRGLVLPPLPSPPGPLETVRADRAVRELGEERVGEQVAGDVAQGAGVAEGEGAPPDGLRLCPDCGALAAVHDELRAAVAAQAGQFRGDLFVAPEIPAEKLRAALREFRIPAGDCVHALIDCSVLGNGRKGVVICSNHLYVHNGLLAGACRGRHVVPYAVLGDNLLAGRDGRIALCAGQSASLDVSAVVPAHRQRIADLLAECGRHARRLTELRDFTACPFCAGQVRRVRLDCHMATCDARPVACRYCGAEFAKREVDRHESACPANQVPCRHCGGLFQAEAVAGHQIVCDPEARGKEGYLSWGCPFCDRPPAEPRPIRPGHSFGCCGVMWTITHVDRDTRTIYLENGSHVTRDGGRDGYLVSDCPHCNGRYSRCRFPIGSRNAQVVSHCRKCGQTEVYGPAVSVEARLAPYFGGRRPFGRNDEYGRDFVLG